MDITCSEPLLKGLQAMTNALDIHKHAQADEVEYEKP